MVESEGRQGPGEDGGGGTPVLLTQMDGVSVGPEVAGEAVHVSALSHLPPH